ncbi:MAG TPA: hypothetical protein VIV27_04695 [Halioglobus sp.]
MQVSTLNNMPHHYAVYGITLASDSEIPGLDADKVTTGNGADIQIHFGYTPRDLQKLIERHATHFFVEPGYDHDDPAHLVVNTVPGSRYYQFIYGAGVEFLLDTQGSMVWCQWHAPLTREDVALYLLGPIIGFMLRLRGTTCLHASGVLVHGNALAITGSSGAGKSTLAASFAGVGYPILTDDVLPLTTIDRAIHTQSGYSRLRLFPHSFKNLQELPDELPPLAPGWDKCFLDLAAENYKIHKHSAPLKVIYVVDWGNGTHSSPAIIPVGRAAAVSLLAANTYRNELLTADMRKQEFYFLGTLVSSIKVKTLRPVDDILSVPRVRDMILADFEQETNDGRCRPAESAASDSRR